MGRMADAPEARARTGDRPRPLPVPEAAARSRWSSAGAQARPPSGPAARRSRETPVAAGVRAAEDILPWPRPPRWVRLPSPAAAARAGHAGGGPPAGARASRSSRPRPGKRRRRWRPRAPGVFFLAGEEYGIDVRLVQEIIRVTDITQIPRGAEFIKGVINLRGRIIPVVDLKRQALVGAWSTPGRHGSWWSRCATA